MTMDRTALSAYLDGELDRAGAEAVVARLEGDAAMGRELARMGEVDTLLRNAFAGPLGDDAPPAILTTIHDGFAARRDAAAAPADSGMDDIDGLLRSAYSTPMDEDVPDTIRATIRAGFAARTSASAAAEASFEVTDTLLRAAHAGPMEEAPPTAIVETIGREFAARRTAMTVPVAANSNRFGWMRIAASVIAVVGAAGMAGFLGGKMGAPTPEMQLALARAAAQEAVVLTLGQALENQVSGQLVSWSDPKSGLDAEITPVRTFKSASGQWCREYVQRFVLKDAVETRRGIACRTGQGKWATEVERQETPPPGQSL